MKARGHSPAPPAGSVVEQWNRIALWLATHTELLGADPARIAEAAESTGGNWPTELTAFNWTDSSTSVR